MEPIQTVCGTTSYWGGGVNMSLELGSYCVGLAPNPFGTLVVTEAMCLVPPPDAIFTAGADGGRM